MSTEADIVNGSRILAIVGLSSNRERYSYLVASYLKEHGFKIIPVNPAELMVLSEKAYPDLSSVPEKVDTVIIFRRSEEVPPIVKEAIKIGAKAVWMQEGIVNESAAAEARQAGLQVVMDRCFRKEHIRLHGGF